MKDARPVEERSEVRRSLPTVTAEPEQGSVHVPPYAKYAAVSGALGTIIIALGGLLSYLPGLRILGSIRADYIPMAPSTAVSFILLGGALLKLVLRPPGGKQLRVVQGLALLVALFGALELLGYVTGRDLNFEDALVPSVGYLDKIPIARMSPATGGLFFITGAAVVALLRRAHNSPTYSRHSPWGGRLGLLSAVVALAFCLSYLYQSPFLYGQGATIPMALTTAGAFFLLGGAITAAEGRHAILAGWLAGSERIRKPLPVRKRFLLLLLIMVGACTTVVTVMGFVLYRRQIQTELELLQVVARSQAHFIEALVHRRLDQPPEFFVDGPDHLATTLEQFSATFAGRSGLGETGEFVLGRKDGERIEFALRLSSRKTPGGPKTIISNTKWAEPMRRALNGESGSVVVLDYRGQTVLAAYEPIAVAKLGIVVKIDRAEVLAPFIRSGGVSIALALVVVLAGTALFFRIGNPILEHLEAYSRNLEKEIDRRRQAETDLARLNTLLAANNKELEQMVYVASHDLRSPLVNINGFSTLLERSFSELHAAFKSCRAPDETVTAMTPLLEKEIPDALRFIRTSAVKMDALIAGLLKLSRSRRAVPVIAPVDMDALLTQVIEEFSFQIKAAGVEVELAPLPPCQGDADQLDQVFSNLLNNALKYLDRERPGKIGIRGRVEGDRSIYCVEDNGIGIDQAHQNIIFEIFHRLDPTRGDGDGLGLSIVQQTLENLSGTIRVESKPGEGSCFYVALPTVFNNAVHRRDC